MILQERVIDVQHFKLEEATFSIHLWHNLFKARFRKTNSLQPKEHQVGEHDLIVKPISVPEPSWRKHTRAGPEESPFRSSNTSCTGLTLGTSRENDGGPTEEGARGSATGCHLICCKTATDLGRPTGRVKLGPIYNKQFTGRCVAGRSERNFDPSQI